jgi:hypothetical protein
LLKRRANIALKFFIVISVVFLNPSSRVHFPAERLFYFLSPFLGPHTVQNLVARATWRPGFVHPGELLKTVGLNEVLSVGA